MADGIVCKHCGHCESAHLLEESDELLDGYMLSLTECKREENEGFSPEDPALARKLTEEAERKALEEKMHTARNSLQL